MQTSKPPEQMTLNELISMLTWRIEWWNMLFGWSASETRNRMRNASWGL